MKGATPTRPFRAKILGTNQVEVELPPSVNHQYDHIRATSKAGKPYMSRKLTAEAKVWLASARIVIGSAVRASGWKTRDKTKVVVELEAYWPDRRERDIHNLHKITLDAMQDYSAAAMVFRRDNVALVRDIDYHIDRENPRLVISWWDFEDCKSRNMEGVVP